MHLPEFVNRKKRNGEILKQNKTPRDSKMAEGKKLNERTKRKKSEQTNKYYIQNDGLPGDRMKTQNKIIS